MLALERPRFDSLREALSTDRTRTRKVAIPLPFAALVVLSGMAFSLAWVPVVHHSSSWQTPFDLWSTYRDAHYVGWGDLGGIYSSGTALVTFPGIAVLLAPVAMLTGALGLTESYPLVVPHPTAWLLLGPLEMILGCIAIFGADALSRKLELSNSRRVVVCLAVSVGLWSTIVLWGHPEDAIATGISCYVVVATLDKRPVVAGWLLGAAVCFQPFVLLLVPLVVASTEARSAWRVLWRTAAPSLALLVAPLAASFAATLKAVLEQPNFANIDHRTPWTSIAPTVSGAGRFLLVAAGPFRSLSVFGAVGIAVWFRKRLGEPSVFVWSMSVVLLTRCFTESVMVAYYLWPPMVFAGILLAKKPLKIVVFGSSLTVLVIYLSDRDLPWRTWWLTTEIGLALLVLLAAPMLAPRTLKSGPVDDDQMDVVR